MKMTKLAWAAIAAAVMLDGRTAGRADEPAAQATKSTDRVEVQVNGMACPFCAYGIEKKLRAIPGARDVKVDLDAGRATFEAPSEAVTEQQVKQAIKDAGFSPGKIEIKHER
jgi:periplasmic mercuric ion binding protein